MRRQQLPADAANPHSCTEGYTSDPCPADKFQVSIRRQSFTCAELDGQRSADDVAQGEATNVCLYHDPGTYRRWQQ